MIIFLGLLVLAVVWLVLRWMFYASIDAEYWK